jgi:hypothetical protein
MVDEESKNNIGAVAPGQVITPGGAPVAPAPVATQPPQTTPAPIEQPQQAIIPEEPTPEFTFRQDTEMDGPAQAQTTDAITWTASEFILHEKSRGWYLGLAAVASMLAVIIFVITRDFLSVGVIIFGAVMFGVYAARKPRQLPYQVDGHGVSVGQRSFSYSDFRTFSIVQDGGFSSIVLLPLKRFSPLLTIYYPPEQEEKVISTIANYLPLENRKQDPIDMFMHKIGF